MNKEVRAVVLGLFVVVIVAMGMAYWRGPAREFQRLKGFRVEVKTMDGDEARKLSIHVPVALLAQLTRLAHIDDAMDGDIRAVWDESDVTPAQILEAADASTAEKPGTIVKDDTTIEVRKDGESILIDVRDDWDKTVHIRLPRYIVEVFAEDRPMSTRDLLRHLDQLNPGDIVTIRDRDDEITITAEPKTKKGLQVSWSR
jgi:hypothetical protein